MKKSDRFISLIFFFLVCFASSNAFALTDDLNEADAIAEAKNLYIQASPMAIDSPQRGDLLNKAITILQNVIEKNPNSLDAHRKLMGIYLLKQDYTNAIRTVQNAITLSPEDPKLFISLAFLYEHSGALDLANGMLGQALKLDPDNKVAQEYKLVIEQKIDQLNTAHQQAHSGSPHASSPHTQSQTGSQLIDSKLMDSQMNKKSEQVPEK